MILNRILDLIPKKYVNYENISQYIPPRYKDDFEKAFQRFAPQLMGEEEVVEDSTDAEEVERKRQNLLKNLNNEDDGKFPKGYTNEAHEQSLRDSQGVSDFSGSPVNGPGNAGGKVNSNMGQRNFTEGV
jgi:hypothetical protein